MYCFMLIVVLTPPPHTASLAHGNTTNIMMMRGSPGLKAFELLGGRKPLSSSKIPAASKSLMASFQLPRYIPCMENSLLAILPPPPNLLEIFESNS